MAERSVLVVGGGVGGMSFAIRMRTLGWSVDLVEQDPEWKVYGAGISITGPTYRALKRLGVLNEIMDQGFGTHGGIKMCAPDGRVIADQAQQAIEPGLPVGGGIMRPALHGILSARTRASGTDIRLGVSLKSAVACADGMKVELTDGTIREYALIVAADGVFSHMRKSFFPTAPDPRYTGQYCWRLVADRPPDHRQCHFYMAGSVTAGLMPTSATHMYMFLLQTEAHKGRVDEAMQFLRLRELMAPFSGLLGRLRDGLTADSIINCRPLEAVLVPRPWHRGRVILIGDAAHATTPHLASGAGIAVEDALVLSDELQTHPDIDGAMAAFEDRRWERCRMVVENSIEIGNLQQTHADPAAIGALMARSEAVLRQDI